MKLYWNEMLKATLFGKQLLKTQYCSSHLFHRAFTTKHTNHQIASPENISGGIFNLYALEIQNYYSEMEISVDD